MPITITPYGFVLRIWDEKTKDVTVTKDVPGFEHLSEFVDLQPRITLGEIFDVVNRDKRLCEFLKFNCFVNIETLHARPRMLGTKLPLTISSVATPLSPPIDRTVDAGYFSIGARISVHPHYEDDVLEYCCDLNLVPYPDQELAPSEGIKMFTTFTYDNNQALSDEHFGAVCSLPIELDSTAGFEITTQRPVSSSEPIRLHDASNQLQTGEYDWTLLDLLMTIYRRFGRRTTSEYTLPQIEQIQFETERAFGLISKSRDEASDHEDDEDSDPSSGPDPI